MKWNRLLAGVATLAVAFGATASAEDEAPRLDYRLEAADGKPAGAAEVRTAVDVLAKRFKAAGLAGVEVSASATPGRLTIALPERFLRDAGPVVSLAERQGTLELRICASESEQSKWRELVAAGGKDVKLPSQYAWAPWKDGSPALLVETPERAARAVIQELEAKGAAKDAAEYKTAIEGYEAAVRENVFTGAQLARTEVRYLRELDEFVVYFELTDARKPYFAAFTERHVGEDLAIIVDGNVQSAPRIKSKLPGAGIIQAGGGPSGFTESEARELAAVISSGALPGWLVRVPAATYRVESWDGGLASAAAVEAAAVILDQRLERVGFSRGRPTVMVRDGRIEVVRAPFSSEDSTLCEHLAERRGRFGFRIRAESGFEQEHRERKFEGAPTPNGFEWIDDEHGGLAALVETPETAAAAKVQELAKKGAAPDDAALVAAMTDLAKAQSENVFTNADVQTATTERSISTHGAATHLRIAVRLEFKETRKSAFGKFTGDHVGRGLAVVLDGKLHVCPMIKSAIPGEGRWIGPGTGYTDEEAKEIAALLACGPLPCRLVAEKAK